MIKKTVPELRVSNTMDPTWKIIYAYLFIGGILSPLYFWGAVMKSDLIHVLTSPGGLQNISLSMGMMGKLIVNAMLRVLAWAPDYLRSVVLGAQSTYEWLWGVKAISVGKF